MKQLKVICLMMIIVMLISGCKLSDDELNRTKSNKENSLRDNSVSLLGYNFESLNPLNIKNDYNRELFTLIYDSLFDIASDFTPTPNIATNAIAHDNGREWTVILKDNILFHDGSKLTASDVEACVNYLLKNQTFFSYNVRNIKSVKVTNTNSLLFTLTEPALNFKAQLTFPIVQKKAVTSEPENMIGTGLYKVNNFIKRKKMTLLPFEQNHKAVSPMIDRIEVQLVPDRQTAQYSYSSGLADVFIQVGLDVNATSVSKNEAKSVEYLNTEYGFMFFNFANPILADINVRKAINIAIDRDKLISEVLFLNAVKTYTPIIPGSFIHNKNIEFAKNNDQAKAYLSLSNYTLNPVTGFMEKTDGDKKNKIEFKILVDSENEFKVQTARLIAEDLKAIGINAQVEEKNFENYTKDYTSKKFDAIVGSVEMAEDFDISSMFKSEKNYCNYNNQYMDTIIYNISVKDYNNGKVEEYKEFQSYFSNEIPHISLYYTKNTLLYSKWLNENIKPSAFSIYQNIGEWTLK